VRLAGAGGLVDGAQFRCGQNACRGKGNRALPAELERAVTRARALDSGLRRNDGEGNRALPAELERAVTRARALDSGLRRNGGNGNSNSSRAGMTATPTAVAPE
jgi:hypothetical protein